VTSSWSFILQQTSSLSYNLNQHFLLLGFWNKAVYEFLT